MAMPNLSGVLNRAAKVGIGRKEPSVKKMPADHADEKPGGSQASSNRATCGITGGSHFPNAYHCPNSSWRLVCRLRAMVKAANSVWRSVAEAWKLDPKPGTPEVHENAL